MQCQAGRSGPCHWAGVVSGTAIFELLQVSGSPEAGLSSDQYPILSMGFRQESVSRGEEGSPVERTEKPVLELQKKQ